MKKTNVKETIIITAIEIIFWGLMYYLTLPAINLHSVGFWLFVIGIIGTTAATFAACNYFSDTCYVDNGPKPHTVLGIITGVLTIVFLIIAVSGSTLFQALSYSKIITMPESISFEEAVTNEQSLDELIIADKSVCQQVGARQLGSLTELVSQYNVADTYTIINHNNEAIRVSPLEYNGFFKWINQENIPGYITVDTNTMNSRFVESEINISPSGYLGEDLNRFLRSKYPTTIYSMSDQWSFELDDEGIPYWIIPCYQYNCSLFGGESVNEVIIVNAQSCETQKVNIHDLPEWVNHAIPGDIIIEHLDWAGTFKSGFFNSLISQKNVTCTTDGYGYIHQGKDIYLYTGITSVAADESNIGFVLVNTRDESIRYIEMPSAEEYSTMDTAAGTIQEKGYVASFPVLINVNGDPVYFLTLKDDAGLIKAYSFVDAQDYTKVTVADTIQAAYDKFANSKVEKIEEDEMESVKISVEKITSAVVNGYSIYYIKATDGKIYTANISASNVLPFVEDGDSFTAKIYKDEIISIVD